MRSKCEECRRAGLECELDCYPCSNCVERGFADVCPERQACAEPAPQTESLTEGSQQPTININRLQSYLKIFLATIYSLFVNLFTSQKTICTLRYLYLPILLFLPLYYSSQAAVALECSEKSRDQYDEWIGVMGTRIVDLDQATPNRADDIELQTFPNNSREQVRATPEPVPGPPAYSPTPLSSPLLIRPPPPASVAKLQEAWSSYIESRAIEWKIITTTACVFVAASPTIFQIPDASDDPIIRSIAFLALCRALSGIVYGPIFPLYFRQAKTKTAHYAMLWFQESKKSQNSIFQAPWIMLSLPAVATAWAAIFYLLAIFSFIWRTGSTADPSEWSSDHHDTRRPISVPLALALRTVVTAITVIDLCCMIWIWRTLRRYNRTVWKEEGASSVSFVTHYSIDRVGTQSMAPGVSSQ